MKPLAVLLAIVWLFMLSSGLTAATAKEPSRAAPRLYVVKIHADWCPRCRHMGNVLDVVDRQYGDEVRFVVLDVTGRKSTEQARRTAKELGLSKWFEEYKTVTSVVALISPPGKQQEPEVITMLFNQADPTAYTTAIDKALAR